MPASNHLLGMHGRQVDLATLPSARWTRREHRAARCGSWVISISVVPISARRRNSRSITASPVAWSRLPVGSSASSSLGRGANARASATRCCSPPESWPGRWVGRCANPTASNALRARTMASGTPASSSGTATFSSAVMVGIRWNAWNTMPIVARRRRANASSSIAVTACPASIMLPALARSSPASTISRLVLPEPDGPMIPTASPAAMSRSMPRRMLTGPAAEGTVRCRFLTCTSGTGDGGVASMAAPYGVRGRWRKAIIALALVLPTATQARAGPAAGPRRFAVRRLRPGAAPRASRRSLQPHSAPTAMT